MNQLDQLLTYVQNLGLTGESGDEDIKRLQRFVFTFAPIVDQVTSPSEAETRDIIEELCDRADDFAAGKDPSWGLRPKP